MKTVKGDLLEMFRLGEVDVIVHGCNCKNAMGAGIAGQIATKFPEAKVADDMYKLPHDIDKLSNYSYAIIRRNEYLSMGIIINLYTQYLPGRDLDINALLLGFKKLKHKINTEVKIGIPEIGCGIAGGDWNEIGPKINTIMATHNVVFVEYEKKTNLKNEVNKI